MNVLRPIGLAVVAATIFAVAGCAAPEQESESSAVVVAPLASSENANLRYDPREGGNFWNSFAMQAVYDPLVQRSATSSAYEPWLATDWEFSNDNTTLSIVLREDVNFIDGEHMTAEVVVDQYTALRDGDTYWTPELTSYGVELEATGEYTFDINASRPLDYRFFLAILSQIAIVSPVAFADPESLATTPVGTGPYILDAANSIPDVELRYTRNEDYWQPERYPYDALTIKLFEDQVAVLNALKSGQINAGAINALSAAEAENSGFALSVATGKFWRLFFGDRAGTIQPAISDVRVRQAMNMVFDRVALTEVLDSGLGTPGNQAFTQGQAEFLEGREDEYPYDIEAARQLMADAGYSEGFDIVIPSNPIVADAAPIVEQALAEINVRVTFEQIPDTGQWIAAIKSGAYPVNLWNEFYVTSIDNNITEVGGLNGFGEDPRVSDLLGTIRSGSPDDSAAASQELGELLFEEAWFAPFAPSSTVWASDADIAVELNQITGQSLLYGIRPAE